LDWFQTGPKVINIKQKAYNIIFKTKINDIKRELFLKFKEKCFLGNDNEEKGI
jgi:hypothetical protein